MGQLREARRRPMTARERALLAARAARLSQTTKAGSRVSRLNIVPWPPCLVLTPRSSSAATSRQPDTQLSHDSNVCVCALDRTSDTESGTGAEERRPWNMRRRGVR